MKCVVLLEKLRMLTSTRPAGFLTQEYKDQKMNVTISFGSWLSLVAQMRSDLFLIVVFNLWWFSCLLVGDV